MCFSLSKRAGKDGMLPFVCSLECGVDESEHRRGEWTLPSLNLKALVCERRSMIFAVVDFHT